jgi:hypothetical protein
MIEAEEPSDVVKLPNGLSKIRAAWRRSGDARQGILEYVIRAGENFVPSFLFTIALPLAPAFIEWFVKRHFSTETWLVTLSVFTGGLLATSKSKLFFSGYLVVTIISSSLYWAALHGVHDDSISPSMIISTATGVVIVHTIERIWRHIGQGERFLDLTPEKKRRGR